MLEFIQNHLLIKEILIPLFSIIVALISYLIIKKIIRKTFNVAIKTVDKRKKQTLENLFKNITKFLLIVIVILIILETFGIDTKTLLASLGVLGLVVGLALQDILKDLLAGLMIITENQYTLGDTIEVNGFKGEVLAVGLKSTRIKKITGEIKVIANRNISEVINYSLNNSLAIIKVPIDYNEDLNKVEKSLTTLFDKLNSELEDLKGEIVINGVSSLEEKGILYTITVPTKPLKNVSVENKIRKEIKLVFDKNNIKIFSPRW